jgi:hypothetical protein
LQSCQSFDASGIELIHVLVNVDALETVLVAASFLQKRAKSTRRQNEEG